MYFQVTDFAGIQPGFQCVFVVLGLGLTVESVAIKADLLVSKLATRHGLPPLPHVQGVSCPATRPHLAIKFLPNWTNSGAQPLLLLLTGPSAPHLPYKIRQHFQTFVRFLHESNV